MQPISTRKDQVLSLAMVKTRVGLEQRQESATPTGANDSNRFLHYLAVLMIRY